jgi:hypothetical protein
LHAACGYTITILVEELVERAEWRETARLPSRALKIYYDGGWLWYNHISAAEAMSAI